METSVQEALKIGLVNDQIHTIVISGGTGVGKSYVLRQCLEKWQIPYRLIPVYIDTSQLQESIDFEASLAQGKMVMASGLLGDTSNRCWVVDDAHVLSPEVRHTLLVEAKLRQILLIMTVNHEDGTLDDAEWELVDVHVSMDAPTLQSKVKVLQRRRDEIEPSSEDLLSLIDSKQVQSIVVPDAMLSLAISYALQARTVGHDAEYVLLQVMKSLAVLDGSSYCKPLHAEQAALYVLPHRMKRNDIPESQTSQGEESNSASDQNQSQKSTETTDDSDGDNLNNADSGDSKCDESNSNELNSNGQDNSNADGHDSNDIDFDDEGRDRIIKWVIEKYGKTNVAQIITYSVLGGKSAIKDAGRVLDVSIPETNNIAKLIPSVPGMNIAKALSKYDKLKDEDKLLVDEMKSVLENPNDERFAVLDSAKKMEGCIRNTGIHACGVIITPEDISNLVPISIAAKDADILVSQFDNSVAESAGLLKMDFLGLRTLTIIKDALKLIKERHGVEINPDEIPLDDTKTYQLFQEGRTIGIFQYESAGMQKYMRELKPTVFADLIAMNALYRPGPIQYIPKFINRKHGLEEIEYDLPETEEYLKETYGITVYQEQVMLLSQKLANFTKGEADTLRKAMGKKQRDVLDKMFPKFIEGGKANNLNEEKLQKI